MNRIVKLDSIDSYNKLYGLETFHPLVTVIDLKQAREVVNHVRMDYGIYALFLKNGIQCSLRYGRQKYDYQEGTVVSFSPGQLVDVDLEVDEIAPDVVGLMFHPDLIFGTPLGEKITRYGFFEYGQREALHLSQQERSLFLECLEKIKREIEHPVDKHSADIISVNIQVLLEYLDRFYDRQFITRHRVNSDIIRAFEKEMRRYFESDAAKNGLPSVRYFADKACLSAGYFSDLVKKEVGVSPKEIIDNHVLLLAKQRLAASEYDISEIAYTLGFQHPQHFTRMFKRMSGISPKEYRQTTLMAN